MTNFRGWPTILVLFGIALAGTIVHCLPSSASAAWDDALPSLYYIPIVVAAAFLGRGAAIGVASAAGAAYAGASVIGSGEPWIGAATEAGLYLGVALTTAALVKGRSPLAAAHPTADEAGIENAYRTVASGHHLPALSQIAAGLIHRFRTPVSSIEGAVGLLGDSRFPDDRHDEFLRIIQKESHRLERALADMEEFTQPRRPRFRQTNLSQLVDEVIDRAGPSDHGPYFLFRKELDPGLSLSCDPDQIVKLLLNLLMNSVEATPGGGQIGIAAHIEGATVLITIRDHGRGIASDIAGRIFDPFFSTHENNLGLGLTVARQIAAVHCGTIAVAETSERGTSISVRLPLNPLYAHEDRPHSGS